MNKQSLECLAKDLQEILGRVWTIRVYSAKECKETEMFDPPCAYLEAEFRLASFHICIDGEVVDDEGHSFVLGREGGHKERVKEVVRWLKEVK
jgi:hypothetical protein